MSENSPTSPLKLASSFVVTALLVAGIWVVPDATLHAQENPTTTAAQHFVFRAHQLSGLNHIETLFRITENLFEDSITTNIEMCRLDLVKNADTSAEFYSVGNGRASLLPFSQQQRDSLKQELLSKGYAKSIQNYEVKYTGTTDTLIVNGSLPVVAYRYDVIIGGNAVEYRLWLTDEYDATNHYPLLSSLEFAERNSSFVASEQFRRIINLVLLRGVEFPPDSGEMRDDLFLVRFDNRDSFQAFMEKSIVFEFQLEEIK